jgi:hypothetical protein
VSSKTFAFFFKISEEEARRVKIPMTRYDAQWKQALYYIEPERTNTNALIPLFNLAYKKRTGE